MMFKMEGGTCCVKSILRNATGFGISSFRVSLIMLVSLLIVLVDNNNNYYASAVEADTDETAKSLSTPKTTSSRRSLLATSKVAVFIRGGESAYARRQMNDLQQIFPTDSLLFETTIMVTFLEKRDYILEKQCIHNATGDDWFVTLRAWGQDHFAEELWKYCAMATTLNEGYDAALYLNSDSPSMVRYQDYLADMKNVAVIGDPKFPKTIHGSVLFLTREQVQLAENMRKLIVDTPLPDLVTSPLLIPQTLYHLIANQVGGKEGVLTPGIHQNWNLLEQHCRMPPPYRAELPRKSWAAVDRYKMTHNCPVNAGLCCSVYDTTSNQVVLMSRHPLLPMEAVPRKPPKPFSSALKHYEEDELPYIATVRTQAHARPDGMEPTPNLYDILKEKDCLPMDDKCTRCLREKTGADCNLCGAVCGCFCEQLCKEKVKTKHVIKELIVTPPLIRRDPSRLIPRIIHQTWFEELTPEEYPNFSRLVESFRRSGWEHKFYTDEDMTNFLTTHFPSEVFGAFKALSPGAFKADLFRYCVLLIHGGVYADIDIQLESQLDAAIPPDVGFMVPVDEPGKPVDRQMCLWNGFIAAAPGHPILAKAIETVVNQVRNRFTSVDVDGTFCPNPELSILHAYDTLFTAGPCLLGATVNRVLARHGQETFVPGDLDPWSDDDEKMDLLLESTDFVVTEKERFAKNTTKSVIKKSKKEPLTSEVKQRIKSRIPGRIVLLAQNKWDMGAHRFTLLETNLVVAATDLPDSNDREKLETGGKNEHYSKAHATTGIYGLEGLYKNQDKTDDIIRLVIDSTKPAALVYKK